MMTLFYLPEFSIGTNGWILSENGADALKHVT
jgi:hypothetical protein